jgi:hypothetical protein
LESFAYGKTPPSVQDVLEGVMRTVHPALSGLTKYAVSFTPTAGGQVHDARETGGTTDLVAGTYTVVLLPKRYQFKTVAIYRSIYSYLSFIFLAVRRPALRVHAWAHDYLLSGIVPGRQKTVMRRHCAPEGEAPPPHDGILPAPRGFPARMG